MLPALYHTLFSYSTLQIVLSSRESSLVHALPYSWLLWQYTNCRKYVQRKSSFLATVDVQRQVIWDAILCDWVGSSQHIKGSMVSEQQATTYHPLTQYHIPKKLHLQQHCCGNLKSSNSSSDFNPRVTQYKILCVFLKSCKALFTTIIIF